MFEISTDKSRLDLKIIQDFLTNSYWAKGRTLEQVKKSIENCLCFGVYLNEKQIGFARVLTDFTVYAYVMDVFIVPEHRGNGFSKRLIQVMIKDERLESCSWMLKTRDAQGLYRKFGFKEAEYPDNVMEKIEK